MKLLHRGFLSAIILSLSATIANVSANDFATVSPSMFVLTLDHNDMIVEQASLTIHPLCFRPFEVDVVASDPSVLVSNLTGVLVNGCGGDTSTFEIEFTGTGSLQVFDLQFVDAEFGGLLASIPVTIGGPAPAAERLLGLLIRRHAITFQVSSSGCTTKGDFQVQVLESLPLQLRLVRIEEDPCDAFLPLGTRVRFSYRELGLQPATQFRVVNPLAVVEVPPRRKR